MTENLKYQWLNRSISYLKRAELKRELCKNQGPRVLLGSSSDQIQHLTPPRCPWWLIEIWKPELHSKQQNKETEKKQKKDALSLEDYIP